MQKHLKISEIHIFQLDRHEEALVDTNVSLALLPTSLKALRTRARIYFHLEKYDTAIADFKSAIQQAETDGNPMENDIHALQSELKKAEAALKGSTGTTGRGDSSPVFNFHTPQTRRPPPEPELEPDPELEV